MRAKFQQKFADDIAEVDHVRWERSPARLEK